MPSKAVRKCQPLRGLQEAIKLDDGSLIPHIEYNKYGNVLVASCKISGGTNLHGTDVNKHAKNKLKKKKPNDDAGHIIPKCMGGSGSDPSNLFPQNKSKNRGDGSMEAKYSKCLESPDGYVLLKMKFDYKGNAKRPRKYIYHLQGFDGTTYLDSVEKTITNS